jgi:Tol biopolymer transport system component
MSRLTFDPGDDTSPVWSPDGSRIAFQGLARAGSSLRQKLVSGAGDDEPLLGPAGQTLNGAPTDWSADGRFLVFWRTATSSDVWILPLSGDRKPFAIAQTPFSEVNAVMAPDGRWIAYQSNESGETQAYVQPFPATGGKYQISKTGGNRPTWRSDGRELFFISPDGHVMAATIDVSRQFEAGIPKSLFATSTGVWPDGGRQYAVSRDGKRLLVNALQTQQSAAVPLTVVVNWLSAVQK